MDMYRDFGINDYSFRLSYRDPKDTVKYFPDDEMWEKSQAMLKQYELGVHDKSERDVYR